MNKLLKNAADPMGLLSEPTSAEMQAWEESKFISDNPYTMIGWLVNYRKNKMIEEFNKAIDGK